MRFGRVDANQKAGDEWIIAHGGSVWNTADCGGGSPDRVYGFRDFNYMIEWKNPERRGKQRELRPTQVEFHGTWKGQIHKCETIDELAKIMGIK